MYAIVDIAGQQFKVEKDQKLFVHRLDGSAGSDMFFDRVLLIDNDKNIIIGNPVISDALISVKILSHIKGDKIKVFKKKRRKGYQVLKGHRQLLTEIQVSEILEKGGSKLIKESAATKIKKEPVAKEKQEKPKKTAAPAKEQFVTSPVKEVTEPVKETVPQKEASKKPEKKPVVKSVKTTGKQSGKAKIAPAKKASKSIAGKNKPSGPRKSKTDTDAKAPKSKPGTAQKSSSKKPDKPTKK